MDLTKNDQEKLSRATSALLSLVSLPRDTKQQPLEKHTGRKFRLKIRRGRAGLVEVAEHTKTGGLVLSGTSVRE